MKDSHREQDGLSSHQGLDSSVTSTTLTHVSLTRSHWRCQLLAENWKSSWVCDQWMTLLSDNIPWHKWSLISHRLQEDIELGLLTTCAQPMWWNGNDLLRYQFFSSKRYCTGLLTH